MSVIEHEDPVCKMQVNPDEAAGKSEHKGSTYYFCSEHCKQEFDKSPERFTTKTA